MRGYRLKTNPYEDNIDFSTKAIEPFPIVQNTDLVEPIIKYLSGNGTFETMIQEETKRLNDKITLEIQKELETNISKEEHI